MKNFRVIKVNAVNGDCLVLRNFLTEDKAWKIAHELELGESGKPFRQFWYVVTSVEDYKPLVKQFLEYRKTLVI